MSQLSNIKERLGLIQSDIDTSNHAIRELQTELEEHSQRAEDFEEQAKTLNLKCRDLEDVMCDREDELRQRKLKIDEIEAESDENSRFSRVLKMRENTNTDRIRDLEAMMDQQTADIERLDKVNSDLQSKCQQMEDKLEDAEDNSIRLKSTLDDRQEEITQLRNSYKSLQATDKKMCEDLDHFETDCRDKKKLLDETSCRAEAAETSVTRLRKRVDELEDELQEWQSKKHTCQGELNQLISEINEM